MPNESQSKITDPLIDVHGVLEWMKVSRTTLWQWVRDNEFPQPIRLGRGQRSLRWRQSVIQQWLEARESETSITASK